MNIKIDFSKKFAVFFVLVFLIEVSIAVFFNDKFIRPFLGDVLVVILLYCFVRMILKVGHLQIVTGVTFFAFLVEFSQYFNLITLLNLQNNKLAQLVIGTTYNIMDLVAYLIGAFVLSIPTIACKLFKKANVSNCG